jgi:hypothetical protein
VVHLNRGVIKPACWLLGIWLFFPTGTTQQHMESMAMAKIWRGIFFTTRVWIWLYAISG